MTLVTLVAGHQVARAEGLLPSPAELAPALGKQAGIAALCALWLQVALRIFKRRLPLSLAARLVAFAYVFAPLQLFQFLPHETIQDTVMVDYSGVVLREWGRYVASDSLLLVYLWYAMRGAGEGPARLMPAQAARFASLVASPLLLSMVVRSVGLYVFLRTFGEPVIVPVSP